MLLTHIHRSLSRHVLSKTPPPRAHFAFAFTTSASSPSLAQLHPISMSSAQQIVEDNISQNKIVVFSKSYCPFCDQTKDYFATRYPAEPILIVELDERNDGSAIQDYLKSKTGARSVPRTFISGKSIGGNDALHALPRAEVDALIGGKRV